MAVLTSVVSLMLLMTTSVQGDFPCICNYNIESAVYGSASKGSPIGYLYEFDCKPEGPLSNDPNWRIIQFEQKYGYIENAKGVEAQTCPGSPPAADSVTTTTAAVTTSTTVATLTTSTPTPTTTTTTTSTPIPTTTTTTTTKTTTPTPTTTPTTSTPKPTTTTATTTTTITTPIPTTTTTTPTSTTTTTTTTTPTPTTTPTTTTPEPTTTTTTTPKPTTTSTPIPSTTTVTTTTMTPRPTTTQQTTHAPTSTTTAYSVRPSSQGHYSCPQQYVQNAHRVQGTVFTIDSTCYEIVPTEESWEDAEADCVARGGHLAHIPDQRHQDIIYNMTMQHLGSSIWIGFHDRNQEQHYEWSSGDPVTYSNWENGHETFLHSLEDCASLATNFLHGRWDDTMCLFPKAYLCEFNDANGRTTATPNLFTGVSGTDGENLTYINWIPNHKGNVQSTETEDCIVLVPYKDGQWDDIPCGFRDPFFGDDMGAQYYSFCEYKTFSSPASLIG